MKTKTAILILAFFYSLTISGQGKIAITKLDSTDLPKNLKYNGSIKEAIRWTDKLGDNIVVTSETGEYQSKSKKELAFRDSFRDAELFAYHYIIKKDTIVQIWNVYDFIKECPTDIEANFVKNTFQVTDLNNDGVAEVWLMYKTACHGDISPCDMNIIMYQGQQKFAMRGQNKVQVSDKELIGGDYKFDKAFIDGPTTFKEFAKNLWDKNIMQTWGK
jgi:hypothetical protein